MTKSIIYKDKTYLLDTKEAKREFYADLTETMDSPFCAYLHYIGYRQEIHRDFKRNVVNVLSKIKFEKNDELYSLKTFCWNFYQRTNPPPVFMVLYYQRKELYDKYLLRLSEKTASQISASVIKEYKIKNSSGPAREYPLPYVSKGELFIFKDQMDEFFAMNKEETVE